MQIDRDKRNAEMQARPELETESQRSNAGVRRFNGIFKGEKWWNKKNSQAYEDVFADLKVVEEALDTNNEESALAACEKLKISCDVYLKSYDENWKNAAEPSFFSRMFLPQEIERRKEQITKLHLCMTWVIDILSGATLMSYFFCIQDYGDSRIDAAKKAIGEFFTDGSSVFSDVKSLYTTQIKHGEKNVSSLSDKITKALAAVESARGKDDAIEAFKDLKEACYRGFFSFVKNDEIRKKAEEIRLCCSWAIDVLSGKVKRSMFHNMWVSTESNDPLEVVKEGLRLYLQKEGNEAFNDDIKFFYHDVRNESFLHDITKHDGYLYSNDRNTNFHSSSVAFAAEQVAKECDRWDRLFLNTHDHAKLKDIMAKVKGLSKNNRLVTPLLDFVSFTQGGPDSGSDMLLTKENCIKLLRAKVSEAKSALDNGNVKLAKDLCREAYRNFPWKNRIPEDIQEQLIYPSTAELRSKLAEVKSAATRGNFKLVGDSCKQIRAQIRVIYCDFEWAKKTENMQVLEVEVRGLEDELRVRQKAKEVFDELGYGFEEPDKKKFSIAKMLNYNNLKRIERNNKYNFEESIFRKCFKGEVEYKYGMAVPEDFFEGKEAAWRGKDVSDFSEKELEKKVKELWPEKGPDLTDLDVATWLFDREGNALGRGRYCTVNDNTKMLFKKIIYRMDNVKDDIKSLINEIKRIVSNFALSSEEKSDEDFKVALSADSNAIVKNFLEGKGDKFIDAVSKDRSNLLDRLAREKKFDVAHRLQMNIEAFFKVHNVFLNNGGACDGRFLENISQSAAVLDELERGQDKGKDKITKKDFDIRIYAAVRNKVANNIRAKMGYRDVHNATGFFDKVSKAWNIDTIDASGSNFARCNQYNGSLNDALGEFVGQFQDMDIIENTVEEMFTASKANLEEGVFDYSKCVARKISFENYCKMFKKPENFATNLKAAIQEKSGQVDTDEDEIKLIEEWMDGNKDLSFKEITYFAEDVIDGGLGLMDFFREEYTGLTIGAASVGKTTIKIYADMLFNRYSHE